MYAIKYIHKYGCLLAWKLDLTLVLALGQPVHWWEKALLCHGPQPIHLFVGDYHCSAIWSKLKGVPFPAELGAVPLWSVSPRRSQPTVTCRTSLKLLGGEKDSPFKAKGVPPASVCWVYWTQDGSWIWGTFRSKSDKELGKGCRNHLSGGEITRFQGVSCVSPPRHSRSLLRGAIGLPPCLSVLHGLDTSTVDFLGTPNVAKGLSLDKLKCWPKAAWNRLFKAGSSFSDQLVEIFMMGSAR